MQTQPWLKLFPRPHGEKVPGLLRDDLTALVQRSGATLKSLAAFGILAFFTTSAFADPQLTSWFTANSGKYARLYETTTAEGKGTSVTTWTNQSLPSYADIAEVASSANWLYIRYPDLASYNMGPWLTPQGGVFQFWPVNQHGIARFPRHPADQTGTKTITGTGYSGNYVNGMAIFNALDGKAWSGSALVMGPHNKPTYYWHRNAPVGEAFNYDAGLGHQNPSGVYHTHQNPIALRFQLGDHVDYDSSTKTYFEDTNAPTQHSPIIGWAYDGYPIYGPYGYSSAVDTNSGIRRMVSGYVARDGNNGTDEVATNLGVIPAWYARFRQAHFGGSYSTMAGTNRPSVNSTYPLGTFAEDYSYLGDLTNPVTGQLYQQGTDFDLDEYNGRYCVTPDFPNGTYAYFVDIDTNGNGIYPYVFGFEYYGVASGSNGLSSISEPVTTNFIGGPDTPLTLNKPTVDSTNFTVTLVWSSVDGGTYQVDNSTNESDWTSENTDVPSQGVSTTTNFPATTTGTNYARVTRTALAGYDDAGGGSGVVTQTAVQSYDVINHAPAVANPIPDQNATYGASFSCTVPSDTFTDSDAGQTLTYSAAGDILGTAGGISFDASTRTFSATTVDSGSGGTITGTHTVQVIATDDGTPALSATNSFTLTINKAVGWVAPNSASRAYGQTNPVFTGTLTGFVAADSISADYSTAATTNSPPGTYVISANLNDPDSTLGNYLLGEHPGMLTITNTSTVISFNFTGASTNNGTASPMDATEVAGVWRAENWNNSTNQSSGTLDGLADSSGDPTPASITWSGTGIGTTAEGNNPGDDRMMKGYVDVTNGAVGTITVTNLPDSISGGGYDVLVYFDGANGSADRNVEFTIGSTSYIGKDYTSYSGTYIQATNTSNNSISTPGANFVLFTNLTGNAFTVTATPGYASDGNPHAEFNGIQIVAGSVASTAVTTNPVSASVCDGEIAVFTSAAQSASALSIQWQVETNGGSSFVNIPGATNATYSLTANVADSGNQYRAVFSGDTGDATTTAATLTVNAMPVATISPDSANVIANSSGNTAGGPAGAAIYFWTISNGTITGATNAQTVTYSAGASGHVTLGLTVANAAGCLDTNSVELPILVLSSGEQSFTHLDSIISLATNVTKDYTFTDPSNGLSVVVAVTMTPYSTSNASPAFKLLDYIGGIPTHMAVDSGLNAGDGNWVDPFEGADFSASLVSASSGILTNSIQFGITGAGFRSDQGYPMIGWTSSGTTSSFMPTNDGLYTLDTTLTPLAGTNYSGRLRSVTSGLYQFNDASPITGQSVTLEATFDEGIQPVTAPTVGTILFNNHQFQFSINGTTGANYVIEAATNLSTPVWLPVFTNPAPFVFTETNSDLYPQRFYRAVAP